MAPTETIGRLLTGLSTNIKRRRVHQHLSDERMRALHHSCVLMDPVAMGKRPLEQTRFVVLDTETTGFHAYAGDEIISIAALEMVGLELTGKEFQTFVNPGRPIPPASTEVHGIRDPDVADSPPITEVATDFMEFLGESVIIGHHINFDIRFLNKTAQKHLLCHIKHPWLDTMLLYTAFSGRLGHYSLDEVARNCRVDNPHRHSARGDALATALIFKHIAGHLVRPSTPVGVLIKMQHEVGHF